LFSMSEVPMQGGDEVTEPHQPRPSPHLETFRARLLVSFWALVPHEGLRPECPRGPGSGPTAPTVFRVEG